MAEPFIGEIRLWACNYAPEGWAICQGGTLPISENTALFYVLGTAYGGDGRTTFGIPNLQGRAPLHSGRGPGLNEYYVGESNGYTAVILFEENIPAHDHIVKGVKGSGVSSTPGPQFYMGLDRASSGDNIFYLTDGELANTTLAPEALGTAGQSTHHENMQPYIAMQYCIALDGMFPQRS